MWLLKSLVRKLYKLKKYLFRRRYRGCRINCVAATFVAVICTAVLLCAVGFSDGGKNKVYAVTQQNAVSDETPQKAKDKKFQAGLMGIMNCISSMEELSRSSKAQEVSGAGEEILVGASKANRREVNRMTIEKGMEQAGAVGYSASQIVKDNHMPVEDYDALLRIVEAEATGGDMKSKILVANVVLNRVNNSHFPDSIYDVVWERVNGDPQFSPTADGRIDSVTISDETIEAVDRALNGEDYSEGALYFIARSSADQINVNWFDTKLQKLFVYGGHEFFTYEGY